MNPSPQEEYFIRLLDFIFGVQETVGIVFKKEEGDMVVESYLYRSEPSERYTGTTPFH